MWTAFKVGLFLVLCLAFFIGYYINSSLETFGIPSSSAGEIKLVYLGGALVHPGVYEVARDETLLQLIERSGGFSPDANQEYIASNLNLSKKIEDEEKIFVPFLEQETGNSNNPTLINLNTASQPELESLPGIGESTAKLIIDGRPYKKIEDLLEVKGIGDSKYNSIKDKVQI